MSILKSSQWMEAMRSCSTSSEESFTRQNTLMTPMRQLIKKFPDLAELVLDKSYKEVKRDSEVCIEMNFEFVEDTFNYKKQKTGDKREGDSMNPMNFIPFKQQDFTFQHFASSDQRDERNEGYEEPYTNDYEMIMRNHPMMIMAENSRTELLRHPLCLALVRKKWMNYGRPCFYGLQLYPYLVFLAFLTMFVFTSPNPIQHKQYYNCTEYFHNQTRNDTIQPDFEYETLNILSTWGILIFTVFFLVLDLLQNKPIAMVKAVMYFNIPWSIIINYVIYAMVLYVAIEADVLHSEVDLRSVC